MEARGRRTLLHMLGIACILGTSVARAGDDAEFVRARALIARGAELVALEEPSQEAADLFRQALALLGTSTDRDEDRAAAAGGVAHALCLLEEGDAAVAPATQALEIRTRLHPGDHPDVARSLEVLGRAHAARGVGADAAPHFERALAMRRRLFQGDHADVARSLHWLARAHWMAGRAAEALPLFEQALATRRRLFPGDHRDTASSLLGLAAASLALGRMDAAIPRLDEALAMRRRLFPSGHVELAASLDARAYAQQVQGHMAAALALHEESLAMRRVLFLGDHAQVALGLANVAAVQRALGKPAEAARLLEESLAMRRRVDRAESPDGAAALAELAAAYADVGRAAEGLPLLQQALDIRSRLWGDSHPAVLTTLNDLANLQLALGRPEAALELLLKVLPAARGLYRGDHPYLATVLANTAAAYEQAGKLGQAQALLSESVSMRRRLYPAGDPDTVVGLGNMAGLLYRSAHPADGLPLAEQAVELARKLYTGDHPVTARALGALGVIRAALGSPADARAPLHASLDMLGRLFPGDHPGRSAGLSNLAGVEVALGDARAALPLAQQSLEMQRRLFPGDHPDTVSSLASLAWIHLQLGEADLTLPLVDEGLAMVSRLEGAQAGEAARFLEERGEAHILLGHRAEAVAAFEASVAAGEGGAADQAQAARVALARVHLEAGRPERTIQVLEPALDLLDERRSRAATLGSQRRAVYIASLRGGHDDAYALAAQAYLAQRRPADALAVIERGRGREMLSLLESGRVDLLERAAARARAAGDEEAAGRVAAARYALARAEETLVRASSELERARAQGLAFAPGPGREAYRALVDRERGAHALHERALRERLRVARESLPETRPASSAEIQGLLAPGERMLVYLLGEAGSYVFVVPPHGEAVAAHRLDTAERPVSPRSVRDQVAHYLAALSTGGGVADALASGAAHPGAALSRAVLPPAVWEAVRGAPRLYLVPHADLHAVPFEVLVVGTQERAARYWLDDGPPITYVASGSVLAWLRARGVDRNGGPALVAVGDPAFDEPAPWPHAGVVIRAMDPTGVGARAGLRPGDVIVGVGEREVANVQALRAAVDALDPATAPVTLRIERDAVLRTVQAASLQLAIAVANERPDIAGPRLFSAATTRAGSVARQRGRSLGRLPATRAEVVGIADTVRGMGDDLEVVTLLGAEATESRVFEAAVRPRVLHLATHGLAVGSGLAAFSALALTPPRVPAPGDDGLLTLADLLVRWQGRIEGTQLVVLSACESQTGPLDRNEGMFSLTWGFCHAGARAVIGSLWRVDDDSTAVLMQDLYRRVFSAAAPSPCDALHAARRALKARDPDPHHWAPFVFTGAP